MITSSKVHVTWALFGSGQWRGGQGFRVRVGVGGSRGGTYFLYDSEVLYHDHLLQGFCHLSFLWFRSVERWSGLGLP